MLRMRQETRFRFPPCSSIDLKNLTSFHHVSTHFHPVSSRLGIISKCIFNIRTPESAFSGPATKEQEVPMEISYEIIPIEKIHTSPLNPRHHVNLKAFRELVESIRKVGILTPLLVRPNASAGDGYEIAASHRHYNAAKEIDLQSIPAIIREMDDIEFLEILTIENLQREDVHPLDEAQGYRTLMEKAGYDVAVIAAKVGKSESYVYQRLKLTELIPEAEKAFADEKITAGHAILIARLQPNDQKKVLEDGLEDVYGEKEIVSVRELADYIETQIHLDLNSASFSKKDPDLLPSAGPCTTCTKRTGFVPALFPDIKKKDTCTDPECFRAKVQAFIDTWLKAKSQDSDVLPLKLDANYDYRKKKIPEDPQAPIPANCYTEITDKRKGSCEHVREGIVVEGHSRGKVLTVCVEPTCKTHRGRSSSTGSNPEMAAYHQQQKAEQEKRKTEETVRLRIVDAIIVKIPKELSKDDYIFLAGQHFAQLWDDYRRRIAARHNIQPVKEQYTRDYQKPMQKYIGGLDKAALQCLLMEMSLIRNLPKPYPSCRSEDLLIEIAKRYHIDPKGIEGEIQKEIKEKKKAKVQTSAKRKEKK